MRLVLVGYFGCGNAGDEAVLAAEVSALRAALGESTEFVVVSGNPGQTWRVHGLPAISRTDVRAILRALRSADGLIAGGGSLLQDVTSTRPVACYGGVMLAARALRCPVFVYAQGLGPLRRRVNRWLAGLALRQSAYLSLRDPDSVALAASLGVPGVDLVPDPVLGLQLGSGGSGSRLAVALRPWDGQGTWLPAVATALRSLEGAAEIVFVPFHGQQDVELAETLARTLGSSAAVVPPDGGYAAALGAVAGSRAVLGMRLHALVAAANAGRPFVALSYDPKVTAFASLVGQPVAATLPGPVDAAALASTLRAALSGNEPGSTYAEKVACLRGEASRPATSIAAQLGVRAADAVRPRRRESRWALRRSRP